MLSYHGVESFLASLRQMGMSTLHRRSREYGLPLILGGAEGTLWELTSMYANLANRAQQDGDHKEQNYYQATALQQGKTTSTRRNEISPASAWMTLDALIQVNRPGTGAYWKRFNSTHKIAWKTGTSFGHRDAWAIGTTPQYTVGVWVGHATGQGRRNMTGVRVAAPILFDTFNLLPLDNNWFRKPIEQMKTIKLCKDDGFLANDLCESVDYKIPYNSHFDRITPNHLRIHLDKYSQQRVHGSCESISNMEQKSWFVLPPDQAYYYKQHHADYKPLPEWRADCQQIETTKVGSPISLIYPRRNTQIYIPRELAGKRGKTLFKAIHQNAQARLFWHLDNTFLGTTQTYHEQAIWIKEGKHRLTLVDEKGNSVTQAFQVLSQ
jgi:penicillin-binding protein 1C